MLIVDGTYLVYKSYYRTKKIEESYGVSNDIHFKKIARNMFLKMLAGIKNKYKPSSLFIVFDCEGGNFRHDIMPSYKSNRKEKPPELLIVKSEIYHFLKVHNFTYQIADNVEGDDLIASYVHQNPNDKIMIFTGDSDMGAVVNENVTLLLEKRKKIYEVTSKNFHHFFPIPPCRMADFKSLQGDKSDFVKGVDGLFRSETLHLLMQFNSVEEIIEKGRSHHLFSKINKEREKILTNKKVTSLKKDCTIDIDKNHAKIDFIYIPDKIASKVNWE